MSTRETRVAKGTVVLFASGEYSDYRLVGAFRVLADIDLVPLAHRGFLIYRVSPRELLV